MLSSGQYLNAMLDIVVLGLSLPRETRDHSTGDWPSYLDWGSLSSILKSEIRIKFDFLKFFVIIKRGLRPIRKGLDQWTNMKGLFEFKREK